MRRREFITLIGGAVAAWSVGASAQQSSGMRSIAVLLDFAEEDTEGQARLTALIQGLEELGWIAERNVRIKPRWGATDVDRVRKYAVELVGLKPDVIMGGGATAVRSLEQATFCQSRSLKSPRFERSGWRQRGRRRALTGLCHTATLGIDRVADVRRSPMPMSPEAVEFALTARETRDQRAAG